MLCFKAKLGRVYISDDVLPYRPAQHLPSADENLLFVPESRTPSYGDRCYDYAMVVTWNALPRRLRSETVIVQFKKNLKTFLFTKTYDIVGKTVNADLLSVLLRSNAL